MPPSLTLTIELPTAEAKAFAQFLKRLLLDDYRAKCARNDDGEAELMQGAGERLREALAVAGIAPR